MPEINLLQNRIKDTTHVWKNQINWLLTFLVIVLVALGLSGAGLLILTQNNQAESERLIQENTVLQSDLAKQQTGLTAAKQFQAQLSNLKTLLGQHVYMVPLLEEIEKSTYVNSRFISINASNAGVVHLEGEVNDYNALAKLILGLSSSSNFSDVQLVSVAPSSGLSNVLAFSIDMKVTPQIFLKR